MIIESCNSVQIVASPTNYFTKHNHFEILFQYSPIIDFYPEDFKIDLNGKKFAWQGVALLPFVDEERLHKALEPLYDELTEDEGYKNIYFFYYVKLQIQGVSSNFQP